MDLIKKLLDLLPVIREGPPWLQGVFLIWLLVSFALVFGLALQGLRGKPIAPPKFSMDLSSGQYIEERQLALSGKGLPADVDLDVRVYSVASGLRRAIPQGGEVVRLPNSDWRYQWVAFQQSGKHEIEARAVRQEDVVALAGPVAVHVGAWAATAPPERAGAPRSAPPPPTAGDNVLDLSRWVTIHDQGPDGTSAAFAAITAVETSLARSGSQTALSARYVYEKAKQHDGLDPDSEGTFLTTIAYVLQHFGVPHASTWPYKSGDRTLPEGSTWGDLDRQASETKARLFLLSSYEEIRDHLASGRPILAGVTIYGDTWSKPKDGWVELPSSDDRIVGFHAVVIVGFDPEDSSVLIANTWGTDWALGGFAHLSADAARAMLLLDQLWAVEVAH